MESCDVLVVGGGNAALSAALTAREAGASVRLLEHAPKALRGGNSRHTRNLRLMHESPTATLIGSYSSSDYWSDLLSVTHGKTDEYLARIAIDGTAELLPWMEAHGARFQPALEGTLGLSRTNAFFLGGGKALMNAYYGAAERLGVEVRYETEVVDIAIEDGRFASATVARGERREEIRAKVAIAAAGGFESNLEWLREAWG